MPLAQFINLAQLLAPRHLCQRAGGSAGAWGGADALWGWEVVWQDPQPAAAVQGKGGGTIPPVQQHGPSYEPWHPLLAPVIAVPFPRRRSSNSFIPMEESHLACLCWKGKAWEPRGVSTYVCCSGPLLTQTPARSNASSPEQQNPKTDKVCTYTGSCQGVWAATELVFALSSRQKHPCVFKVLDFQ